MSVGGLYLWLDSLVQTAQHSVKKSFSVVTSIPPSVVYNILSYLRPSIVLTFFSSNLCTRDELVKFLFCFLVFLVKMWLLNACLHLILPDPVRANLFLAPEIVFILGIPNTNLLSCKYSYQTICLIVLICCFIRKSVRSCDLT